jgi:hypothetical protein
MFNEYYPICGMSNKEIISSVNGDVVQIKLRDRHFYVIPKRVLDIEDFDGAMKDLVRKLMAVVEARSLVIAQNAKRRKEMRRMVMEERKEIIRR